MAFKKTVKRKKPTKKGMSNVSKFLIGGAVISGGWLLYENFFNGPKRAAEQAKKDLEAAAAAAAAAASNSDIINNGSQAGNILNNLIPGILPAGDQTVLIPDNKRKLSPLGTPSNKLNWGMKLYKGDKGGEIESLQRLFNRLSSVYGTNQITVDGVYGKQTEDKRLKNKFSNGITLMKLYKIVDAQEKKANKKPSGEGWDSPTGTGYDILYTLGIF
jgi:hypothetical protein